MTRIIALLLIAGGALGCCQYANHAKAQGVEGLRSYSGSIEAMNWTQGFGTKFSKDPASGDVFRFEAWHLEGVDREEIESIAILIDGEIVAEADWHERDRDDRLVVETAPGDVFSRGSFHWLSGHGLAWTVESFLLRVTTDAGNYDEELSNLFVQSG